MQENIYNTYKTDNMLLVLSCKVRLNIYVGCPKSFYIDLSQTKTCIFLTFTPKKEKKTCIFTTRKQRHTKGKNRRYVAGITLFRGHTDEKVFGNNSSEFHISSEFPRKFPREFRGN